MLSIAVGALALSANLAPATSAHFSASSALAPAPLDATRATQTSMQFGRKPAKKAAKKVVKRGGSKADVGKTAGIIGIFDGYLGDFLTGPQDKFGDGRRELLAPREFNPAKFDPFNQVNKYDSRLIKTDPKKKLGNTFPYTKKSRK